MSLKLKSHGYFWLCPPKYNWINFYVSWFLNLYQHERKWLYSICSFFSLVTIFLTMPIQKIFDQLLIFVITYQHAKKQSYIPSVHSSDTVNFIVPSPDWLHPFLTIPSSKSFNHLLICVKLHQNAKTQLH